MSHSITPVQLPRNFPGEGSVQHPPLGYVPIAEHFAFDQVCEDEISAYLRTKWSSDFRFQLHAGSPMNLWALDENQAPFPIDVLIQLAINGSVTKLLGVAEIFSTVEDHFIYYRALSRNDGWKHSIRHALAFKSIYKKVLRTPDRPGRGNLWTLDIVADRINPYKRLRRRKRKTRQRYDDRNRKGHDRDFDNSASHKDDYSGDDSADSVYGHDDGEMHAEYDSVDASPVADGGTAHFQPRALSSHVTQAPHPSFQYFANHASFPCPSVAQIHESVAVPFNHTGHVPAFLSFPASAPMAYPPQRALENEYSAGQCGSTHQYAQDYTSGNFLDSSSEGLTTRMCSGIVYNEYGIPSTLPGIYSDYPRRTSIPPESCSTVSPGILQVGGNIQMRTEEGMQPPWSAQMSYVPYHPVHQPIVSPRPTHHSGDLFPLSAFPAPAHDRPHTGRAFEHMRFI
ncbi:hypothetical protein FISHEDRAFT_75378 [Fistulina hepatica ATCC 64428]|uniref:Fork-head domain-containing protein n=1 Tax=Fistulina hepatica ATCC 64428 TaxID=1128425 RepID=A0A0D7A8G1_9AGAR|nr:hypothetical protein FISHEDRAFT_75378 [Fistulina hepatica ATCC 64428]